MTLKPFWLAALAMAWPLAAPAGRAAEADRPTPPKCLAHAKALCFLHHPVCLALDAASSLFWGEWSERHYTGAMPAPSCPNTVCCSAPGCVAPACACVPAGAPAPCWQADTCWQAGVMPPPAPLGAPMPCPAPAMSRPAPVCFPGTTPAPAPMTAIYADTPAPTPVTVYPQPMPLYVPCCTTPDSAPAHYLIETKLVRTGGPRGAVDCLLSRCMMAEGAQAEIAVRGPLWDKPDQPAGALGVRVARAGKHKVGLEIALECGHGEECGPGGGWMQYEGGCACRTVPVGKPTHVVLRKGPGGAEEAWAEVTVSEAPHAGPERIAKAPRPLPPPCPVPGAVAGIAAAVGEMCGCQTWAAGMTLPSGRYLQHPPQYFPPAPAFPLPRELASQEAAWSAVAPPVGMVVPAPLPPPVPMPVMAVPLPAPPLPTDGCVVKDRWQAPSAGVPWLKCKSLALQVPHDDEIHVTAGKGHVEVYGPELKATADSVRTTMGGRLIVLQGHVRLTCHAEGHPMHIKANRIKLTLEGEHVEVLPTAPAAE